MNTKASGSTVWRMLHQFSHETFPEAQIYRQGRSSSIVQFGRFELSRITMDNKDLAQLSQPRGQRTRKANKNNIDHQKVSTTFWLSSLVHDMPISGDPGWRLHRESEVELF